MPADGLAPDVSVTVWLERLKAGDPAAAQPLWDRYFTRLVRLARGKLSARVRRGGADEEDVALSAFDSFCRAVDAGRFPRLDDKEDLWAILVTLTERKAHAHTDRETAAKRGGGMVRGDSVFLQTGDTPAVEPPAPEPTPDFVAEVAEECERLLAPLDGHKPGLREVALWKLEGFTNEEIASKTGTGIATVERRLAMIRTVWTREDAR